MGEILHQGGCQCGRVRFRAEGSPKFISNCHCHSCRKATGAAFSTWIGFAAEQVAWPAGKRRIFNSSEGVERGYCADCGTPLTYAGVQWPGELHFLIGVFDDPSAYAPRKNVFIEDALTWALAKDRE
ncbi:MAG: GFA family protein [Pseudomonadota bacterium]